jgi:hypothetical protein
LILTYSAIQVARLLFVDGILDESSWILGTGNGAKDTNEKKSELPHRR